MHKSNLTLWIAVGALFVAFAGVAAYKAWPLLFPEVMITAPLDPNCDLRQSPCVTEIPGGGSVRFSINPRHIPPLKALQLEVATQGLEAGAVAVDFTGTDMNMGFNRPQLERVSAGLFRGTGQLPVCVRDSMEWEARVLVQTHRGTVAAPFRFLVRKSDSFVEQEGETP